MSLFAKKTMSHTVLSRLDSGRRRLHDFREEVDMRLVYVTLLSISNTVTSIFVILKYAVKLASSIRRRIH